MNVSHASQEVGGKPSPYDFEDYISYACQHLITDRVIIIDFRRVTLGKSVSPASTWRKSKKGDTPSEKEPTASDKNKKKSGKLSSSDSVYAPPETPKIIIYTYYDHLKNLTQIKFDGDMLAPQAMFKIIQHIIAFHPHVISFCVNGAAAAYTVHEIQSLQLIHQNLTDISMDNTFIPEANYDLLLKGPAKTKYLSLARCCINDDVVQRIFTEISREPASKTLNTLNLASNRITDAGLQCIADVLRSNRQLYYLNISANQITDDGVKIILDVLQLFVLSPQDVYMKRRDHIDFLIEREARKDEVESDDVKKISKASGKKSARVQKVDKSDEDDVEFEHVFSGKNIITIGERSYCMGNNALCVLNIAYNNLSMMTLRGVLRVMEEQRRCDRRPRGLLRVNIEGNYLPESCDELDQLQEMLDEQVRVTLRDARKGGSGTSFTTTPRKKPNSSGKA